MGRQARAADPQAPDQGVKFHDGTAWDAKAAKWNLDRLDLPPVLRRPVQPARHRHLEGRPGRARKDEGGSANGPFTFELEGHRGGRRLDGPHPILDPNPSIVSVLTGPGAAPISPEAYNKAGKDAYSRKPVGAGPYRFVEWQSGSHVVLEKNPDYWRKGADGQPLPYIDKLTYRLIIDDSVRLLELRSGNAHFTELVQGKDIGRHQERAVADRRRVAGVGQQLPRHLRRDQP